MLYDNNFSFLYDHLNNYVRFIFSCFIFLVFDQLKLVRIWKLSKKECNILAFVFFFLSIRKTGLADMKKTTIKNATFINYLFRIYIFN